MQGSKTKPCGRMICQLLTAFTVRQNPAVKGQPKATILGCKVFAKGSGKDTGGVPAGGTLRRHMQADGDEAAWLGSDLQNPRV